MKVEEEKKEGGAGREVLRFSYIGKGEIWLRD